MKSCKIPSMELESILSELKKKNEDPHYKDKVLILYGNLSDEQQIAVFDRLFKRQYERNFIRTGMRVPLNDIASMTYNFSFKWRYEPSAEVNTYLQKIFKGEINGK